MLSSNGLSDPISGTNWTPKQMLNRPKIQYLAPILLLGLACISLPDSALAQDLGTLVLVEEWIGIGALRLFAAAYLLVIFEEKTHLRKSKPVLLAAGLIWALVGYEYASHNLIHAAEAAVTVFLIEFVELCLF